MHMNQFHALYGYFSGLIRLFLTGLFPGVISRHGAGGEPGSAHPGSRQGPRACADYAAPGPEVTHAYCVLCNVMHSMVISVD